MTINNIIIILLITFLYITIPLFNSMLNSEVDNKRNPTHKIAWLLIDGHLDL